MLHGHTAFEDTYLLPPLSTAKFRRWNCQNCRAKIYSPESGTANQIIVNIMNGKVKNESNMLLGNAPSVSHPDGTNLSSRFPQQSEERMLGAGSINADSALIIDKLESHPSLKNENGSAIVDISKEGFQTSNDRHDGYKEKQRQSSESTHVTIECEVYQMRDGKREATKSANTSETDPPGCGIFKDGHDGCKEKQRQSNESTYIAIDFKAYQMEDDERNCTKRESTSGTAPDGNKANVVSSRKKETKLLGRIFSTEKFDMMSAKQKETKSNQGTVGANMSTTVISKSLITDACGQKDDQELNEAGIIKESDIVPKGDGMTMGLDFDISNNDLIIDSATNMSDEDSMDLNKGTKQASEKYMDLKGKKVQMQNITSHLHTSIGKLNQKKARKVRTLDDILRSEDLHVSKEASVLSGDAETSKISDRMPDASEERADNPDEVYIVNRKNEANLTKRKQRNKALQDEDEEHSLMHWLKRLPKEPVSHNRDAKSNHTDIAVGLSKSVAEQSTWKEIKSKQYRKLRRHKKNTILSMKTYIMPREKVGQPWLVYQEDNTAGKGCNPEDMHNQQLNYKGFHSLPTKVIIPKKSRHHGLKVQDSKHQKNNLKNNKDKIDQVVLREPYQMHWFEGSTGFNVKGKVRKKHRTMRPFEQEAVDDIPMDIVELLAKNLHERRMMNAETKNIWNFTQTSDNVKHHYDTNVTECCREKASDAVNKDLNLQNSKADIVKHCSQATIRSKPDCRLNARYSSCIGKQNHHTNQNQQKLICAPTRLAFSQCNSPPRTESQIPVIDSFSSSLPKNLSWDRKKMQPSVQNHTEHVSDQNSSKKACDISSVLLNRITTGINGPIFDAKLDYPKKDCDGRFPESIPITIGHKTDCQKYMDTANKDIPCNKGKAKSSNSQGIPAKTFYMEGENRCHSEVIGSVNSYSEEHKSALNLLKLMDWAAWSGQPHHASLSTNQLGLLQESEPYHNDRYSELLGLGAGVRSTKTTEHPLAPGFFDQDKLLINPCKPLHPFPVIGNHRSSLQKEFTNHSVNFRTVFDLNERHSRGPASINIDAAEKAKAPYSATHTKVPKFQPSISITENSNWFLSTIEPISHLKCAPARDAMDHIELRNYGRTVQPSGSSCVMEACVINRNPADFTIPDEDNEYMRGTEGGRYGYVPTSRSLKILINRDGQKQQKRMKLTT